MSETLGDRPTGDVIGKVRSAHKLLCELPPDRTSAAFHRQLGEVERLLESALMEAKPTEPRFTLAEIKVQLLAEIQSCGLVVNVHYTEEQAANRVLLRLKQARLQESRR